MLLAVPVWSCYNTGMITKTLEQISANLQYQSSELYHTKAAINNLELIQKAQQNQNLSGTALWTGTVIEELQNRAQELELSIKDLTEHQEKAYSYMLSAR